MAPTTAGPRPATQLRTVLWLAAIHSAAVGLGLVFHPQDILVPMGYQPLAEPFFPVQGGVFHLVMALGYGLAAADLVGRRCLAEFAVWVKSIATVFLLIYWVFVGRILIVLVSAVGDGVLAAALFYSLRRWRRSQNPGGR